MQRLCSARLGRLSLRMLTLSLQWVFYSLTLSFFPHSYKKKFTCKKLSLARALSNKQTYLSNKQTNTALSPRRSLSKKKHKTQKIKSLTHSHHKLGVTCSHPYFPV